jgi:F-type H+-transporting ATPase subunit b
MDQLIAVFGIEWELLIAETVNFLILLAILTYFLYRPVMKVLAERSATIKKGLEDAEAAAHTRTAVEGERAGIVAAAHHEGELIVARAEDEGKSERNHIVKSAQDRAEALLRDAAQSAEEAKRRALKESEGEIARAAVLAAEKILRTNQ